MARDNKRPRSNTPNENNNKRASQRVSARQGSPSFNASKSFPQRAPSHAETLIPDPSPFSASRNRLKSSSRADVAAHATAIAAPSLASPTSVHTAAQASQAHQPGPSSASTKADKSDHWKSDATALLVKLYKGLGALKHHVTLEQWKDITEQINKSGLGTPKTVKQVRDKWDTIVKRYQRCLKGTSKERWDLFNQVDEILQLKLQRANAKKESRRLVRNALRDGSSSLQIQKRSGSHGPTPKFPLGKTKFALEALQGSVDHALENTTPKMPHLAGETDEPRAQTYRNADLRRGKKSVNANNKHVEHADGDDDFDTDEDVEYADASDDDFDTDEHVEYADASDDDFNSERLSEEASPPEGGLPRMRKANSLAEAIELFAHKYATIEREKRQFNRDLLHKMTKLKPLFLKVLSRE
ncbi:hypothetical protein GOP47_0004608 [Adiantum capillus-veneris]|uniref:Myb-like domain-containing protein n=1 Tax=Adiantum capillus-veneris TaxID=13818 RepID=A0A9D4V8J7_ADICA|nr:hypothetical protein GOP47_0004608 [Adiantum capillus-veneris]